VSRSRLSLLAACLFLLIVGARCALFNHFGTDMPEMDEWDAEGMALLLPWSLGQLHWQAFFIPQNEHRVVLTHALAFSLTALNGQWDQRLEAVVLALMPATIALLGWRLTAGRLTRRWQVALFLLLAGTCALPVAWQNVLAGFSSAQFFLIGLSLGAVATLPFAEPYERKWWGGVVCVVLALGSLGSGFFAAAVVTAILGLQVWRGTRRWSSAAPGLVVCALTIVAGFLLRVIVPTSDPLKAQSIGDFILTVAKALGWPAFDYHWGFLALLLILPWVLVTARLLDPRRRNHPADPWHEFLSGMGWWVLFQAMAAGYARGAGGPSPAPRYVDTLIVGSVVNLLCLQVLWQRSDLPLPRRNVLAVFVGAWALVFVLGLAGETYTIFTGDLPPLISFHRDCELHLRQYLATGDENYLRHPGEIPYPLEWAMKRDLDYPGLAERLPASVRRPLALVSDTASAGFVRCDSRGPEQRDRRLIGGGAGLGKIPMLDNAVTWGSFGTAAGHGPSEWHSRPLTLPRTEWLKFDVSGDLGRPGTRLELRDAGTGRTVLAVAPEEPTGTAWRGAWVKAPAGRWVLAATNASEATWFAFSEPTEMSLGSRIAAGAAQRGIWLTWGAGLLALGILITPVKRVEDNALHLNNPHHRRP
jgi:hypothetical protein